MIARRTILSGLPALTLSALTSANRRARAAGARVLRIGTQKGGAIFMAERQQRGLESLLNPLGIEVQWVEFPFGPPIMEAIRVGSVDLGYVGDAPPIFAQAARTDLVYVGAVPASAEAILLPAGSTVQGLRDLKGKRIAYARGSSAHNLTIAAIEKADLTLGDVQLTALAPADAAAAFERGAVDAWTIWDPYYAIYETRPGVRVLTTSDGIAPQNSFLMASRSYVGDNPGVIRQVLAELSRLCVWALANRDAVARLVANGTGIPYEASARVMARYPFQVEPMSEDHVRSQQDIADRFHRLGVIPARISIRDAVWNANA